MKNVLLDYLHGRGNLAQVKGAEDFDSFCQAVREDVPGRLRWQLYMRLGLVPWEGRPGRDELLYAAAQLRLDREAALDRLCPACRARAEGCAVCGSSLPVENPVFDEQRYEELKRHGTSEL